MIFSMLMSLKKIVVNTLDVLQIGYLYVLGDSITSGQNATDWGTTGYVAQLRNYIGGVLGNYSAGGSGIFNAINQTHVNLPSAKQGLLTSFIGYNDVRNNNTYSASIEGLENKIKAGHRIILSNNFGNKFYYPNTTEFTKTGTWNSFIGSSLNMAGKCDSALITNDTSEHRLTITAKGKNFSFCFVGDDGTIGYGNYSIIVDGITIINNDTLNNKTDGIGDIVDIHHRCPWMVNIFELSDVSHAIEIVTNGIIVFCYMCDLTLPEIVNPAILISPIYFTSPVAARGALNAEIDRISTIINDVTNEYKAIGYPIEKITGSKVLLASDMDTDGIHPKQSGHDKLYNTIKNKIKFFTNTDLFTNRVFTGYSKVENFYTGILADWSSYAGSSLRLPANTDGHIIFDLPNLTDSNFGILGFSTSSIPSNYSNYPYALFYGPDSGNAIQKMAAGTNVTTVKASPLDINGKVWFGRELGRIKIKYAANGIDFTDSYDGWGVDNREFWLNINFNKQNKKMYNPQTFGFV